LKEGAAAVILNLHLTRRINAASAKLLVLKRGKSGVYFVRHSRTKYTPDPITNELLRLTARPVRRFSFVVEGLQNDWRAH
jgi:hypothetical protein